MNTILAFELDLKKCLPVNSGAHSIVNQQTGLLSQRLSVLCDEVLLLKVANHCVVWAATNNAAELRYQIQPLNECVAVYHHKPAINLFKRIVHCDCWSDVKQVEILLALHESRQLAMRCNTLGVVLQPLIEWGLQYLQSLPVIAAFENFWSFRNKAHRKAMYSAVHAMQGLPAMLLRVSVN
jgi:hypothetical protein